MHVKLGSCCKQLKMTFEATIGKLFELAMCLRSSLIGYKPVTCTHENERVVTINCI